MITLSHLIFTTSIRKRNDYPHLIGKKIKAENLSPLLMGSIGSECFINGNSQGNINSLERVPKMNEVLELRVHFLWLRWESCTRSVDVHDHFKVKIRIRILI